jgi:hypothetical protein
VSWQSPAAGFLVGYMTNWSRLLLQSARRSRSARSRWWAVPLRQQQSPAAACLVAGDIINPATWSLTTRGAAGEHPFPCHKHGAMIDATANLMIADDPGPSADGLRAGVMEREAALPGRLRTSSPAAPSTSTRAVRAHDCWTASFEGRCARPSSRRVEADRRRRRLAWLRHRPGGYMFKDRVPA